MKELKVTKCEDCPCVKLIEGSIEKIPSYYVCTDNRHEYQQYIKDIKTIPEWCKLKDVDILEFKPRGEGFCFRCEKRAVFLEHGAPRPRFECGDPSGNKYGCYSHIPVMPVVVKGEDPKKDPRPQFGPWFISSRSYFVRIPKEEFELDVLELKDGKVLYWRPKIAELTTGKN